jgi:hypothetical protein
LRNLQNTLRVYFSDALKSRIDDLIGDLEGAERTMELVAADFLKYSVEETLRKFFCVIRSERRGPDSTKMPISNPEQCVAYLRSLFHQLSKDMKDDHTRWVEDYYRIVAPLYLYIRTRTCACGSRPRSKFRVL